MSGYSGTPLPRKLGIAEGGTFAIVAGPDDADDLLGELPAGARRVADPAAADVVLVFTVAREELARHVEALGRAIFPDRMLWVAWPKRASKVPTDVTEDVIRDICLPMGLVDVKVCAVDATWSGLKLMVRKTAR